MTESTTARQPGRRSSPSPRRPWLALAVLILGVAMALSTPRSSTSRCRPSAPAWTPSEATLSWIISGYALAYGLALIPAGRIGDRIGHKWVFFVGLALFTVASLACGLAQDDTQLIVARVVQGLAGGIFFPPVTALIQLMFPPQMRGKAFAIWARPSGSRRRSGRSSAACSSSGSATPTAGARSSSSTCRSASIAVDRRVPAAAQGRRRPRHRGRRPASGCALLAGAPGRDPRAAHPGPGRGLAALDLPLPGRRRGAGRAVRVLGAVDRTRAGRARWSRRRLFAHASFTGGVILALVYFAAFTSIFFTISIFWQAGLGHTALESGLVSIPFAIGSIVGASQSNRLAERLGRTVLVIGTALVAIGLDRAVARAAAGAGGRPHQLGAARAAAGRGLRQRPVHRAERPVHRRDGRPQRGRRGVRRDRHHAAGRRRDRHRHHRQRAVRQPGHHRSRTRSQPGSPTRPTLAMAVSAAFAVAAFALVFVLPKKVSTGYDVPSAE